MLNTVFVKACLCLLAMALIPTPAAAEPAIVNSAAAIVLKKLRALYPATQFDHVKATPVPGIYEVKMGENIIYSSPDGRYFFLGALFDMRDQTDLTARAANGQSRATGRPASRRNFALGDLPLNRDAFARVKGAGERKVVLFSDTECPYCRQLEATLNALENVTIYTFPVSMLGAPDHGVGVWCARDRAAAWMNLMTKGEAPDKAECANPLQRNNVLAASLGVRGTPMMFNERGEILAGAQSREAIEAWLVR